MNKKIKFITGYTRPYTFRFIFVLLIILVTTVIVTIYPYLFGNLVDVLFYNKDIPTFFRIVIIYFIIYMINQVLHYCLDIMVAKLYIEFSYDIKKGIFNKVLSYKAKHLTNLNSGDIIFRINSDADEVLNFIYGDFFYGLSALLDFSMCLGMTAYISLPLAGVSLALVIITFIVSNAFNKKLKPFYDKVTKMSALNQSWLFEFLNGMRDIRLLNATKYCTDKYMNNEFNNIKTYKTIMIKETIAERTNVAIQVLSSVCIFSVAAFYIVSNLLTLGALVACIDYFNRMILTLNRMYSRIFSISRRMISIDRIIDVHNQDSEQYNENTPINEINRGEVCFHNVEFSYTEHKKVLNGLNLYIKPGEKIAIVGKSGEGKSTIVELLCGMLDVDGGEITIDGKNINSYNLHDLRSKIGLVHQTTTIFNHSIRYNLVFTNDEIYDDEIWKALKQVEMDDVIKKMSNGLSTILDSSKTSLSGGQNQRLSIARVYLKKPKILVFDESTSALDGNTERGITKSWDEMFKEHTILIVAHRLSTIMKADRVAFLEDGKIIRFEKHTQLLESCPQYRSLFNEQYSYYLGNCETI